jgi:hypothetical protein
MGAIVADNNYLREIFTDNEKIQKELTKLSTLRAHAVGKQGQKSVEVQEKVLGKLVGLANEFRPSGAYFQY